MGGQSSKSVINSLNQRITEIATKSVANCVSNSSQDQSQDVVIGGFFSWSASANVQQNTEIKSSCLSDDQLIQNLQNQVIDTIGSSTTADGISLLPAFGNTTSESIVTLNNIVRTSLSKENISNNYNSIIQKQRQSLKNVSLIQFYTTATAIQGAQIFAEAVVKSLTDSQVMSTIQSHLEVQTKATSNNPLDIIGRAFSSVFGGLATVLGATGSTIMFAVFALMITIVSVIVLFNKSGSTKGLTDDVGMALKARAGVVPTSKAPAAKSPIMPKPSLPVETEKLAIKEEVKLPKEEVKESSREEVKLPREEVEESPKNNLLSNMTELANPLIESINNTIPKSNLTPVAPPSK